MSNGASYYALTVVEQGASTAAYYSLTPTSNLEMSQGGGVTMDPTAASATMVNIYPQTLQIQAPAGSFTAGVTIVTSDDRIAGRLLVSPPVDVAVVVTLYGVGGQQIGQSILDPAVGSLVFSFPVSAAQSIPKGNVAAVLQTLLPKPKS
jgi:hypothetical protein